MKEYKKPSVSKIDPTQNDSSIVPLAAVAAAVAGGAAAGVALGLGASLGVSHASTRRCLSPVLQNTAS